MRRALGVTAATLLAATSLVAGSTIPGAGAAPNVPPSPTENVAGPQHWCSTNGVTCADPNLNWDEYPGYQNLVKHGVNLLPYIGHDEPQVQFYSNTPGSATAAVKRCSKASARGTQ